MMIKIIGFFCLLVISVFLVNIISLERIPAKATLLYKIYKEAYESTEYDFLEEEYVDVIVPEKYTFVFYNSMVNLPSYDVSESTYNNTPKGHQVTLYYTVGRLFKDVSIKSIEW